MATQLKEQILRTDEVKGSGEGMKVNKVRRVVRVERLG